MENNKIVGAVSPQGPFWKDRGAGRAMYPALVLVPLTLLLVGCQPMPSERPLHDNFEVLCHAVARLSVAPKDRLTEAQLVAMVGPPESVTSMEKLPVVLRDVGMSETKIVKQMERLRRQLSYVVTESTSHLDSGAVAEKAVEGVWVYRLREPFKVDVVVGGALGATTTMRESYIIVVCRKEVILTSAIYW